LYPPGQFEDAKPLGVVMAGLVPAIHVSILAARRGCPRQARA
jgi:hypothetical protein